MANNGWLGQHALPTKLEEANVSGLRNDVRNKLPKGTRRVNVRLSLNDIEWLGSATWNLETDLNINMGHRTMDPSSGCGTGCSTACVSSCKGGCRSSCSGGCSGSCDHGCSGCGSSCSSGCSGPGT